MLASMPMAVQVGATAPAQQEAPLQIDFDWVGTVPQEVRKPVEEALAAQRALVPDDLRTVYWWRRGPEPYAGFHCAGPWLSQGPAQFPVTPTHFVVTLPANRSVVARSTACLRPTVGVLWGF